MSGKSVSLIIALNVRSTYVWSMYFPVLVVKTISGCGNRSTEYR